MSIVFADFRASNSKFFFSPVLDESQLSGVEKIVVVVNEFTPREKLKELQDRTGFKIEIRTEEDAAFEFPEAVANIIVPRVQPVDVRDYEPINSRDDLDKMSMILPGLYLSNASFSGMKDELVSRNIRRIVNVTEDYPNSFPDDFLYLRVPVKDQVSANISDYFKEAADFIEEGIKEGGVLVHCAAGISRSPTIVAAYLMFKRGISSRDATYFLQLRRDVVDINFGFICALMMFEKTLFRKYVLNHF